jgi:small subunit ribosomal protein S21
MRVNRKHKHESFESMMRRFKKGCEKTDILNEVKKREHFEKPSMTRRISRKMAVKKESRRQEDQDLNRFPG